MPKGIAPALSTWENVYTGYTGKKLPKLQNEMKDSQSINITQCGKREGVVTFILQQQQSHHVKEEKTLHQKGKPEAKKNKQTNKKESRIQHDEICLLFSIWGTDVVQGGEA